MAKVLEMPKLSPTMEEGQISAWHKKEGDSVAVDDLLAEVETDKATMEFRSFDRGTLLKILAPAGSVVKLGQPVAVVGAAGEDVSAFTAGGAATPAGPEAQAAKAPEEPTEKKPAPAVAEEAGKAAAPEAAAKSAAPEAAAKPLAADAVAKPATAEAAAKPAAPEAAAKAAAPVAEAAAKQPAAPAAPEAGAGERVKASPYVRKLAREQEVDLHGVAGSGPGGRIVARDLEQAAQVTPQAAQVTPKAAPAAAATPGKLAEPEVRPLSMMRKAIARRLTESKQTVPHFYLTIDVDAGPLASLRDRINADLAASDAGAKVSYNDLLIKACAIALVRVPECNAQFTPEAILVHRRVDISVAVAVAEGLVTPVVRDADRKGVLAIAAEVRDLAARAKAKKLRPEEMANGTFSISNLGMYGIDSFAAVINPPEGAILAVGRVRREPVVRGDAVVPGDRLAMTLSCDHRVVDGSVGATFLKELRALLEHPMQLLLH